MSKTLFVDIHGDQRGNPLKAAIEMVAKTLMDIEIAETLVDGDDVEVDFAITGSARDALRIVNETESTLIIIAYFKWDEREGAEAFAARFPDRQIHVTPMVGAGDGDMDLVPFMIKTFGEATEEEMPNESPTS